MKRQVLQDGNGSSLIQVQGLGTYILVAEYHQKDDEIKRLQEEVAKREVDCDASIKLIEIREKERDQLKAQITHLGKALLVVTDELESWKATEECPESIRAIREGKLALLKSAKQCLAIHDAEVIERFKDELVKSVNVMFQPHIEGVCAVVQQRIHFNAEEVKS
ncbi:hypothetical protein [Marinobacterium lutimaris]|uniref:Uncharacterized protein n=1 Tax=Marinobacterium lutimaris TaxID=568106 RepID=A0A1H5XY04_9GAMM|nr:hypothetical protein [Marinobacterium lutimaris]SEG16317.1 hypothetical protein SAMN05444390_1011536 [Marinobacterium lutimaris]